VTPGASTRWNNLSAAHHLICSPSGSCGKTRISSGLKVEGPRGPSTSRSTALFGGWRGFRRLRFLLGLGGEQGQLVDREAVAVMLPPVLFPRLLRGRRAHMNQIAWLELFAGPLQHAFPPRENRVLHPTRAVLPSAILLVGGVRRHRNEQVRE
jgi:hypothetical protein